MTLRRKRAGAPCRTCAEHEQENYILRTELASRDDLLARLYRILEAHGLIEQAPKGTQ